MKINHSLKTEKIDFFNFLLIIKTEGPWQRFE